MSNSNIEITIEDIIKAKNNDESSIMLIFNKYSLLINKYSTSYHLKNYDSEDLKQEAFLAVAKAINKYNIDKGLKSFNGYIITTIKNLFYELARGNIRFNEESSLNLVIDGELNLIDIIEDKSSDGNIEMSYINNELLKELAQAIHLLEPSERQFLYDVYYKYKGSLLKYNKENGGTYYNWKKKLNSILEKLRRNI